VSDLRDAVERKGSFLQTVRAVGWSFFGVRRRADLEQDVAKLNPVHVIVAGVLGAVLFVVGLAMLVRWVVGSGVAGG
jgi:hypothetical protein